MRIAVLSTGRVDRALARGLHAAGHQVTIASPDGGTLEADGDLVTGQQQHSGAAAARVVIEALAW